MNRRMIWPSTQRTFNQRRERKAFSRKSDQICFKQLWVAELESVSKEEEDNFKSVLPTIFLRFV
jgi:hypothetical protein